MSTNHHRPPWSTIAGSIQDFATLLGETDSQTQPVWKTTQSGLLFCTVVPSHGAFLSGENTARKPRWVRSKHRLRGEAVLGQTVRIKNLEKKAELNGRRGEKARKATEGSMVEFFLGRGEARNMGKWDLGGPAPRNELIQCSLEFLVQQQFLLFVLNV